MTITYIAIGSNLNDPLTQVNNAMIAVNRMPMSQIIAVSSYYRTSPLGPPNQPDYLNAAVALETHLDVYTLLDSIQRIELQHGRERKIERWGPRVLDIDLILFGNEIINDKRLTIPHYDVHNRGFVLWPLIEIAPTLCLPNGKSIKVILEHLNIKKPSYW